MNTVLPAKRVVNHPVETADRFLVLDGLRGVAAFAVILEHMPSGRLAGFVPNSALSVDFFFVLSGFVLAHAYGARLAQGWSPWTFMRTRLIRLYPFYILGTAIGIGALLTPMLIGEKAWVGWSQVFYAFVPALFFLPVAPNSTVGSTFEGVQLYPYNFPAWSLFFELVANLAFAFLAKFLNWRVFAVMLPLLAALVIFTLFRHADTPGPGWLWPHLDAGLARVLFGFFAGVAVYRLHKAVVVPAVPWWVAVVLFIAVIAVPVSGMAKPAYDSFAAIVLFPALVVVAAGSKVQGSIARTAAALGLLSYGVYAIHAPLIGLLAVDLGVFGMEIPDSELSAILVAAFSALIVAIAYKFYDVPVRAWLSRTLSGGAKGKR